MTATRLDVLLQRWREEDYAIEELVGLDLDNAIEDLEAKNEKYDGTKAELMVEVNDNNEMAQKALAQLRALRGQS